MELPPDVKAWLEGRGITDLYPIQKKAVEAGLFKGHSLLVSAPTGSGKTLVAEMAIANALFEGKKAIYLVPLRSLAFEKLRSLRKGFEGWKIEVSVGDYHKPQLGDFDVLIATYERMDSILRHSTSSISEVGVVVVDEVHYVDDEDRGPTLEVVITQLKRLGTQLIALSATIGNLGELARWLGAVLVVDNWRPVPLREGVMNSKEYVIWFEDGYEEVPKKTGKAPLDVALYKLNKGEQVLYFAKTRKNAEKAAEEVAKVFNRTKESLEWAEQLRLEVEGELGERLSQLVSRGVAFHHAGLTNEAREIVEEAFRAGVVKFLAATPTLAAGVNLPAKTVVIESAYRFELEKGSVPIKVSEYKQMAGRAGRPGLDKEGTSILIVNGNVDLFFERYVKGFPEDVESSLVRPRALRRAILGLLASGFARDLDDAIEFFKDTLYAIQVESVVEVEREVKSVMRFLKKNGMIDSRGRLTEFGKRVALSYVDPLGVKIVLDSLRKRVGKASTLGYLHLVSLTPDMPLKFVNKWEMRSLSNALNELEVDLIAREVEDFDPTIYFSALKTALILKDWVNEVPEDEISKKYSVYPGDVRVYADTASWLVHAYSELARFKGMDSHSRALASLEIRLKYGVREELVELVTLKYIGRARARKLWLHGIRSREDLLNAGERKLASILGPKVAKKVIEQLERELSFNFK
ncbi:extensin [Ignicoccus islandicus DSM 13165]|uniref:ATP-dependent DNA helicase Hel308 n=1 Tax=Ignicoccus islandicus DSM 13165 TaxID=940295 RepID=A0A0U3G0T6_9CREN|nr:DEAD/DEAH box helicase [Ignicoccus islandicus]ALU11932.1 extensin [Ignicoccus islandicus DSM 13165]